MSYLKHPILTSPGSWINTIHASKLYRAGHYNLSGPFTQALVDTKADGSSTRFPRGEVVQLAVQQPTPAGRGEGGRAKAKYWIAPATGVYTSHYIINNHRYVEHMASERRDLRFYPKKLAHRHGTSLKGETTFIPDISDVIVQGIGET
ncbi:uncharacterized protein CANTADRAFT_20989 [Suhomyces tanzawaensis NRRL Y-17324]|uniref:Uncharacterized protein n=1 Tax=Suhomyces tanzawaensis NRRL Y-17324 TaxID=984487 RepID=A0A1E4SJT0_9ASCO|nr:uncharacterized protein CANTADRAFT_20989 [Suhomyces tanzawaensis NRRL Y-17324]ODV79692.1 hypothetical protein CANTADRAFT_20989 [Suhomyces tanzawaensis NRRL Y-17324]